MRTPEFLLGLLLIIGTQNLSAQISGNIVYATFADLKADDGRVFAKMPIIPRLKREIYLQKCTQFKDSSGVYITIFTFSKPGHVEAKDFTIVLNFDSKISDITFSSSTQSQLLSVTRPSDNLSAMYHATSLPADALLIATILSKQPIYTIISGISGQLTQSKE